MSSRPRSPRCGRWPPRCCWSPSRPPSGRSRAGPRPCQPGPTPCCCAAPWTPPRSLRPSRSPARTSRGTRPIPARCPASFSARTPPGPGLVAWDRWAQPNHNSVTLAASGAGKSYLAKLEILRSLYQGTECWVIDPENEYERLAAAIGGAYVRLGAPDVHLNPFDLPAAGRSRPDALTRRALFLHTVVTVLLGGEPSPAERAALDTAIMGAYQQAGITSDPRTWARPAPLLPALAAALRAATTEAARTLADRLVPFTEGTHSGAVRRPDHDPPPGAPGRVLAAGRARRAAPGGDAARPGRHLAHGRRPRPAPPPADHRRRGVDADEGPRGRAVPVPDGQVRPQSLGRACRGHPGRRRRAGHRAGPGHHLQRRHPGPAPPGTPGHRAGHRRVQAHRRGAAAAALGPPRRGAAGRRAVRPGLVPGPGLTRRALPGHRPTRPRSPASRPASPARPPAQRCPATAPTERTTCCHDGPHPRGRAQPPAVAAGRPGRPVPGQSRRLRPPPRAPAARRRCPLRAGGRAAARRRRGHRRRRPGAAAPPPARRLRRRCPAGHGPGPAAGQPGRGGGAVGPPDRAAAPALGPAVARPAAPGLGVRLGRRRRRRDDDPAVGARHDPARPDRAGGRGRLARRAHRHRPGRPAAPGRRPGGRRDAAAGPPGDPPAVCRS